jgi:hypothetical protein
VALVYFLGYGNRLGNSVEAPVVPKDASAPAPQPAPLPSSQASGRVQNPTNPLGPSAQIREQFSNAKNYAAFINDALTRPSEGGRFYAYAAFSRCEEVLAFTVAQSTLSGAGISASQKEAARYVIDLQERCSGVKQQFPDGIAFARSVLDKRGEQDPTFSVYNRVTDAYKVGEAAHANDLQRAIGGGDPFDIVTALELGQDTFTKQLIDRHGSGVQEGVVHAAFSAAACEVTSTCATSLWVIGPCATTGQCGVMDRSQQLRAQHSGKERDSFDQIKQDVLRMVNAKP